MHVTKNIFLIFCCLLFLSRAHSLRAAEHYQAFDSDIDLKTLYLSAFTSGLFVGSLAWQCIKHWKLLVEDSQDASLNPQKMFAVGLLTFPAVTTLTWTLYSYLEKQ